MNENLNNLNAAFLATDGFEEIELSKPWQELRKNNINTKLISIKEEDIQSFNHFEKSQKYKVDDIIKNISVNDFDLVILPGGVHNPDILRTNQSVVDFIKAFDQQKKLIAAICHGPWVLVEADIVQNKKITSWSSIKTDIANAGGNWVDQEVVVDKNLITSRKPDDLESFCREILNYLRSKDKK
jgi:protease I